MRLNVKPKTDPVFTHEGMRAVHITPEQELRRSVMACLLWEDTFYESGVSIADRIIGLVGKVKPETAARTAVEARTVMKLRHVPLLVAAGLAKRADLKDPSLIASTIADVIRRPDELTEFLAIYWQDKRCPLDAQVKKGLDRALRRFDEYQLSKYDRDGKIKLRDVIRLVHPKPSNEEQSRLWKGLINRTLKTADTWEAALSDGGEAAERIAADAGYSDEDKASLKKELKKHSFERLLTSGKMGYLALLRNLRNMVDNGVDEDLIRQAILARKGAHYVLPFRFVTAARMVPRFERELDHALVASLGETKKLPGMTAVLVDVSGSMKGARISSKSILTREDVAGVLGSIFPGEHVRVFPFATHVTEVPFRLGMAGVDVVRAASAHLGGGTNIAGAIDAVNRECKYNRIAVITDEQAGRFGSLPSPHAYADGYFINVAAYQNGVGYGNGWTHIDGFSEAVFKYIAAMEGEEIAEETE